MITAEEYALENMQGTDLQEIEDVLIGFGRLCAQEALKAAADNATGTMETDFLGGEWVSVDRESILTSFDINSIQ